MIWRTVKTPEEYKKRARAVFRKALGEDLWRLLMREELAKLSHEQWSGWMEYLFSKGTFNEDGTWTMPKWAVNRWMTQMKTPYSDLSEDEKNSDREEADKFMEIFRGKGEKNV